MIFNFYCVATAKDDAISMAQIYNTQRVISFHDKRADGNYIVMLKFNIDSGDFIESYSVKIDYYSASSEISNSNQLNIFGYSLTNDKIAFIRVSINNVKST